MKIAYQGIAGSYRKAVLSTYLIETISCKTFDECFEKATLIVILELLYQSRINSETLS